MVGPHNRGTSLHSWTDLLAYTGGPHNRGTSTSSTVNPCFDYSENIYTWADDDIGLGLKCTQLSCINV